MRAPAMVVDTEKAMASSAAKFAVRDLYRPEKAELSSLPQRADRREPGSSPPSGQNAEGVGAPHRVQQSRIAFEER